MIDYPNLIPECNVDTVFVEMLGYKRPNHASDIAQVCQILDTKMPNQRAMGFIDNDKKKPLYYLNFEVLHKVKNAMLVKHRNRQHYLVVVKPAMDKFIFTLCQDLEINISKYHLPSDLRAFISFTKKASIRNNPDFRNFVNTIIQNAPDEIQIIKSWIKKYSPYKD